MRECQYTNFPGYIWVGLDGMPRPNHRQLQIVGAGQGSEFWLVFQSKHLVGACAGVFTAIVFGHVVNLRRRDV